MIVPHGISLLPTGYVFPTGYKSISRGYTVYPVGTCHPRDMLSRGEHPVVTHGIHARDKNVTHGIHPRDIRVFIPWVLSRVEHFISRGCRYPVGDRGYPVGTLQVY